MAESGALNQLGTMCANRGLLVDVLDLTSVEDECLGCITTEDQHIGVVKLDTCARH